MTIQQLKISIPIHQIDKGRLRSTPAREIVRRLRNGDLDRGQIELIRRMWAAAEYKVTR